MLGSFVAIAGLLWLSLEYLINPDVAFWLDRGGILERRPSRAAQADQPLRLSKIQAALQAEGFSTGQPIVLKTDFTFRRNLGSAGNIAIPVLKQNSTQSCQEPCRSIYQLRVYRALQLPLAIRIFQGDPYFRLTQTITTQGPSENDLRALEKNPLISLGSDQSLPLTQSEIYDQAPQPGFWLRLVGLQTQGSSVSTYGQVYYFNPFREQLALMLNWASPPGEVPQWQQVTGNQEPELVLNQLVGLEPQYQVYQIQSSNGAAAQLRPILLNEPALNAPGYADALALARSGLWTPAQKMLSQVKQENAQRWSLSAQGQLDLIQLHARVTQAQAAQPSASGVQRVMGYLINGSWSAGLDVLQSDRTLHPELQEMLLSDSGRLGSRIDTVLKVMPGEPDAVVWGALLRRSRGSKERAIAWAQQQAKGSVATLTRVEKFIQLTEANLAEQPSISRPVLSKPLASPSASGQSSTNPSSINPSSTNPSSASPPSSNQSAPLPQTTPGGVENPGDNGTPSFPIQ